MKQGRTLYNCTDCNPAPEIPNLRPDYFKTDADICDGCLKKQRDARAKRDRDFNARLGAYVMTMGRNV